MGRTLAENHFDVCIAGAGVAGITLALKLSEAHKSVLLLEGGGGTLSAESQDLYDGQNIGMEYLDLRACRLRFLGGTSNHWGGWCRPLDAYDFQRKEYIPHSGWPIDKSDVAPYEDESYDICDVPRRPGPDNEFVDSNGLLKWFDFGYSPPTRFRDKYWKQLGESNDIHLVLNANVTDLRLDERHQNVRAAVCRSHHDITHDHELTASRFVLSMGGIENARALLNANNQARNGLGNENDLVGRYFCDHPYFEVGLYWQRARQSEERFLAPTPALQRSAEIANCGLRLVGYGLNDVQPSRVELVEDFARNLACDFEFVRDFFESIGNPIECEHVGHLTAVWEQTPNPESRVLLSDTRDKFGLRTANLDWRWTPIERRTVRVCATEVGKAFARGDIGRVRLNDWVLNDNVPLPTMAEGAPIAGQHHMGTTRMSDDPSTGVVDSNCRVFGLSNLFIAGSSVFPTVGQANPTFTIVQLTLRLADHLTSLG